MAIRSNINKMNETKWQKLQKFGKKKANELGLKTEQDVYSWLDEE